MKTHAQGIVPSAYNLVFSDEMLLSWRTNNSDETHQISDEELRAKLKRERAIGLIGTEGKQDPYFIYGRGTVCHIFHVKTR